MATGITKRHSRRCASRQGRACSCQPSYEAWVYLPRERRKVRRTFRRKAEATSWRADALVAATRGALRPPSRDPRTLLDALDGFVAGMRAGTVRPKGRAAYKPATVRSYEKEVRRVGQFPLARLKVSEIRREDVQALVEQLLDEGLAAGSVSNVLNPIQAFYRRAIDRGELAANPTERIDLPAPTRARPTRVADAEEARLLVAALPQGDRPVWATAFYAGLRRGELQALRWRDVDLATSRVHVERSWDQLEGPIEPKSTASRRTIPLLAILRDHLDQLLLATGRGGEDLVFGRSATVPFAPMAIGKRAKAAWAGAELEPITLHQCRHTFASLLIDAGANPKAIQAFMGHSKIQTTFDIYGHLMPGSHDDVRALMDAYLDPNGAETGAHPGAQALVEGK